MPVETQAQPSPSAADPQEENGQLLEDFEAEKEEAKDAVATIAYTHARRHARQSVR
jgi:hypothetical protein